MDFKPIVRDAPEVMDVRIFRAAPMGLREDMLSIPLDQRFTYDPQQNLFFINFEGLVVRTREEVERIRSIVAERLSPLPEKVYTIVNYDNFTIFPEILDAWSDMVRDVTDRFYSGVTRYTTSTFLRTKLGHALQDRDVAPHIYESADEARQHLRELEQKVVG